MISSKSSLIFCMLFITPLIGMEKNLKKIETFEKKGSFEPLHGSQSLIDSYPPYKDKLRHLNEGITVIENSNVGELTTMSPQINAWFDSYITVLSLSRNIMDVHTLEEFRNNFGIKLLCTLYEFNGKNKTTYIFTPERALKNIIYDNTKNGLKKIIKDKKIHQERINASPYYSFMLKKAVAEIFQQGIKDIINKSEKIKEKNGNALSQEDNLSIASKLTQLESYYNQLADISDDIKEEFNKAKAKFNT